jgi:hypothetical protein
VTDFVGYEKDRRGMVTRGGEQVQVWHYRVMQSQPMIKWSKSRMGTLNGEPYVFAVTLGRGRAYAYFKWRQELLFFFTGAQTLSDGEAIEYAPPTYHQQRGQHGHRI